MYNSHFEEQQAQFATEPSGSVPVCPRTVSIIKMETAQARHRHDDHEYDDGLVHSHSWASSDSDA